MIARITIAMPASKADPTLTLVSASARFRPSPGAPIRAVITTIESASIRVWLIARPIGRRDRGSITLRRTWPSVAPSDRAASMVVSETLRIPSEVIRMVAGTAKMSVATVDGATPMRNRSVIGVRYASVGMICRKSRIGDRTAAKRRLRPAAIPSGTPTRIASRTATSSIDSTAIVASHRPRKPRIAKPDVASTVRRTPPKAMPAAAARPMTPGHPSEARTSSKTVTRPAIPARIGSRMNRFAPTHSRTSLRDRNRP